MTKPQILWGYCKRRARFYYIVICKGLFIPQRRRRIIESLLNDVQQRRQNRPKL